MVHRSRDEGTKKSSIEKLHGIFSFSLFNSSIASPPCRQSVTQVEPLLDQGVKEVAYLIVKRQWELLKRVTPLALREKAVLDLNIETGVWAIVQLHNLGFEGKL